MQNAQRPSNDERPLNVRVLEMCKKIIKMRKEIALKLEESLNEREILNREISERLEVCRKTESIEVQEAVFDLITTKQRCYRNSKRFFHELRILDADLKREYDRIYEYLLNEDKR